MNITNLPLIFKQPLFTKEYAGYWVSNTPTKQYKAWVNSGVIHGPYLRKTFH